MSKALRKIFFEVPHTYELVNHVITFGMDIIWRRRAARLATSNDPKRCIDMCSGTGEMAAYLSRQTGGNSTVIAADFSLPMLKVAMQKPEAANIDFILADAKHLPFRDAAFDIVTSSYATRNMNVSRKLLIESFSEFARILKPGGSYVSVETSQPPCRLIRRLYHLYVRLTVKQLGSLISRTKAGYAYLSYTIPRFYVADDLAAIMREAGFGEVSYQRMMMGAAAIHKADKQPSS